MTAATELRRLPTTAIAASACLLVGSLGLTSCGGDPLFPIREDFAAGRYASAYEQLTELVDDDSDDVHLYRMERGVVSIARRDPDGATQDFRSARDRLDEVRGESDWTGWVTSVLLDDRQLQYEGYDYEVVLIRALLAVVDLVSGRPQDAEAYTLQVTQKQEELIQSFETEDGQRPKENYKLVAFGSYLRGIINEERLQFDVARRSFERVREIAPDMPTIQEDIRRVTEGVHSQKGNGVVWVVALVGRGPCRIEVNEPVTQGVLAMAQLMWAIARQRAVIPNISDVPIPAIALYQDNPTEVHVSVGGESRGVTRTVTDVNATALREFEAMKSQIVARAVVRRAFKIVVTEGVREVVNPRGRDYEPPNILIDLAISLAGILWTATEGADLRCWGLLPAQFQVLRVELPAGEHDVEIRAGRGGRPFGEIQHCRVRVQDGFNTYVLAVTPTLGGGPPPLASDLADEEPKEAVVPPPEEVP